MNKSVRLGDTVNASFGCGAQGNGKVTDIELASSGTAYLTITLEDGSTETITQDDINEVNPQVESESKEEEVA